MNTIPVRVYEAAISLPPEALLWYLARQSIYHQVNKMANSKEETALLRYGRRSTSKCENVINAIIKTNVAIEIEKMKTL